MCCPRKSFSAFLHHTSRHRRAPVVKNYSPQLPVLVSFESGSHKINIGAIYDLLILEKSNALLGFHAFTGCDQGFTKPPHMPDICLIYNFQSTVIQPHLDGKNWERFWCLSWRMNLQLQKLLSKWAFVNVKQVVVPCDANVRRIVYRNVSMYWIRKRYCSRGFGAPKYT